MPTYYELAKQVASDKQKVLDGFNTMYSFVELMFDALPEMAKIKADNDRLYLENGRLKKAMCNAGLLLTGNPIGQEYGVKAQAILKEGLDGYECPG